MSSRTVFDNLTQPNVTRERVDGGNVSWESRNIITGARARGIYYRYTQLRHPRAYQIVITMGKRRPSRIRHII